MKGKGIRMGQLGRFKGVPRVLVVGVLLLALAPMARADSGPHEEKVRPVAGGVSAGNINHFERRYCYGGTLGAFLQDGENWYALSNNHVFGRENAAQAGEQIVQPGLNDAGCSKRTEDVVGQLSASVPLNFGSWRRPGENKVDAAIARVDKGQVAPDGSILDIGPPATNIVAPAINGKVKKSGRTTGLTRGTIASVNATIVVNYGDGKYARFREQFTVTPGAFIRGGDSGSVAVEDVSSSPRAVGLLYAGSDTHAIASPMSLVFDEIDRVGPSVSMVGAGTGSGALPTAGSTTSTSEAAAARAGNQRREEALLELPDVVGVAVGRDRAIEVYLANENEGTRRQIPPQLDNAPVRVIVTGEFRPL